MTESSETAPKKLKLTLKLGGNNKNNNSDNSSLPSSQVNSSTLTSPVKLIATADSNVTDLPSGLGNLKGRGRPKKENEKEKEKEPKSSMTTTSAESSELPRETVTVKENNVSNEYAVDLKTFVSAMKTFEPRKWSLKRPISLELKNVAGYEIEIPSGLWCTYANELGSVNLKSEPKLSSEPTVGVPFFEAICECGKIFNDKSKYRKHSKIHSKKEESSAPIISVLTPTLTTTTPTPTTTSTPTTISLKLKINTNATTNN